MWVSLKKPYKIVANKEKRYADHYKIPVSGCLIIPHARREDEMLCNVHWRENDGLHVLCNIMFDSENLELVNSLEHGELFDLWASLKPIGQKVKETTTLKEERMILSPRKEGKY